MSLSVQQLLFALIFFALKTGIYLSVQKYPPIYRGLYILALKNKGYIVFAPNRTQSNEEPKK